MVWQRSELRSFSSLQLSPYLGLANLILRFCFCLRLCFASHNQFKKSPLSSLGDQNLMYIAYRLLLITYYLLLATKHRQD